MRVPVTGGASAGKPATWMLRFRLHGRIYAGPAEAPPVTGADHRHPTSPTPELDLVDQANHGFSHTGWASGVFDIDGDFFRDFQPATHYFNRDDLLGSPYPAACF